MSRIVNDPAVFTSMVTPSGLTHVPCVSGAVDPDGAVVDVVELIVVDDVGLVVVVVLVVVVEEVKEVVEEEDVVVVTGHSVLRGLHGFLSLLLLPGAMSTLPARRALNPTVTSVRFLG